MLTKAAIKEMIIPSLLCFITNNFILCYFANWWNKAALSSLGAMLLGVIVTGLFVAVSMTAGGGANNNAKKYIEDEILVKGSEIQICSNW